MTNRVEFYSRSRYAVPVVLALLCLFHLVVNAAYFRLENLPPSYDCAYHLNFTLKLHEIWSEPGHQIIRETLNLSPYYPPVPYIVTALFYFVGGTSTDVAYLSLLPWMFLLIVSIYISGRCLFGRDAGLLAAAIVSSYPISFGMTRSYYPDIAVLATVSLTFACFLKSKGLSDRRWSLAFGLAAGLAQMTKWTAVFFWLGAAVAYAIPYLLLSAGRPEEKLQKDHRFLNRLLAGYLVAFVVFAFLLDALLDSLTRSASSYIPKLILATLLFHGFLLAGVLLFPLTSRLREILSETDRQELRIGRRLFHLLVALALAGAICLPWYLHHLRFLIQSTAEVATDVAADRGIPSIADPRSLLAYLFFFESHQVHLMFFVLLVIAAVFSSRKTKRIQFVLLFGLAVGYLAMTCVRLKDPRYSMPFLHLAALATAGGLLSLPGAVLRRYAGLFAAAAGLVQYLLITFGFGLSPGNWVISTPYGQVAWFRAIGYGSHEKIGQDWHVEDVVEQLGAEAPLGRTTRVYTLVNHHCIHYEAFNYDANRKGLPLRFDYPPLEASGQRIDMGATLHQADYLLLKRGGDLGPGFSIRGLQEALKILLDKESDAAFGFRREFSYDLPDGSQMELWRKEDPAKGVKTLGLDFGGIGRLLRYRLAPLVLHKGEKALLRVTMEVTPELVDHYHLFVHLYSPANEFMGSFGGPFPVSGTLAGLTVMELDFLLDTAGALDTDLGQLAIGVWNPETGGRLPITDTSSGERKGDIVYLDSYLRILEQGQSPGTDNSAGF